MRETSAAVFVQDCMVLGRCTSPQASSALWMPITIPVLIINHVRES